jgi:hypothetical protein
LQLAFALLASYLTQDVMVEVIRRQYAKLTPARIQQIRGQLATLYEEGQGRIVVSTGCSGTDLLLKLLCDLVSLWKTLFGLEFSICHAFSCDHGHVQQGWIQAHEHPQALFEDMAQVGSEDLAMDVLSDALRHVPSSLLYACGIECDSLSALNSQAARGEGIVQKGEGKTGTSAQAAMAYVERRQPDLLLFECVKGLGVAPKRTTSNLVKQSDLDMLIEGVNKLGYVFVSNVLDSLDYGFPASRQRYYILG